MESSSHSNKHDIQDHWIEKLLECPVCYNIPRDLPIPQCPAGHIICKTCRDPVSMCPTCRGGDCFKTEQAAWLLH